jgi:histidinol-phosphate aminotransferase
MTLIRPLIQRLKPYVPGEQPKIKGLIKLNTNENPYPPSPKVLAAVRAAVDGRLRLYPNPTAQGLRERLARYHNCEPDNIIVGNGSDELLALATRCFVEPAKVGERDPTSAGDGGAEKSALQPRSTVQFLTPSYSLYPVLAAIHGAQVNAVPLHEDFTLPSMAELRSGGQWQIRAALTFITTPNAPSGRAYSRAELGALCQAQKRIVLLDEAYVDFGEDNALGLALQEANVLVARTFSKAYCLCFQRVGYCVGHPDLIAALHKIRDSYNVNGLGQIAAKTTLDNLPYYRANFRRICQSREELSRALAALGFTVLPSQANFILARPPRFPAHVWLKKLRERKVLVRWFDDRDVRDYIRITIGTDQQTAALLRAIRFILGC